MKSTIGIIQQAEEKNQRLLDQLANKIEECKNKDEAIDNLVAQIVKLEKIIEEMEEKESNKAMDELWNKKFRD